MGIPAYGSNWKTFDTEYIDMHGKKHPAVEEVPLLTRFFHQWDTYYYDYVVPSGMRHERELMGRYNPEAGVSSSDEIDRINKVNRLCNARPYYPDPAGHDVWQHDLDPDMGNDCEDYVLTKRRLLIEEHGFDPAVLRPIICQQRNGRREQHMLLGVQTKASEHAPAKFDGMMVLDNLTNMVVSWFQCQYVLHYILGHSRTWHVLVDRRP